MTIENPFKNNKNESSPDLTDVLKNIIRPNPIKGMEGDSVSDPTAQEILDHPEQIQTMIALLQKWGVHQINVLPNAYGFGAVVLDAGENVVRISTTEIRETPGIPQVLQSISGEKVGLFFVQLTPKLDTTRIEQKDVDLMLSELDALGYVWNDAGTDNLGRDSQGRLLVLDGSVTKK